MAAEPVVYRKFQHTALNDNMNRTWEVRVYPDGSVEVEWSRTGSTSQKAQYQAGWDWESKVNEKLRKGYREIELHKPKTIYVEEETVDPAITQVIEWIYREANEKINSTLAGSVDTLSQEQIKKGRALLQAFVDQIRFPPTVLEEYYNTIPTQLPHKIDLPELQRSFNPAAEETRLDQLEAALATYQGTVAGFSRYAALGAIIKPLDPKGEAYRSVSDYLIRTGSRVRITGVFSVRIPAERTAYDGDLRGKHNVTSLWHGTRNPNVRHILRSGLRVPAMSGHVSNGSRFGRGIYFADRSLRSMNYTGSSRGVPKMMFLADVALGTPVEKTGDAGDRFQIPDGYDSVWGKQSYSGMDEFVIQRQQQQTIRFLITYE